MPNLATEALAIALTITVVEQIVRHESRQRVQPRRDRALRVLGSELTQFARMAQFDYVTTHLKGDLPEFPDDPVEMLRFWQERYGSEDNPRALPGRMPLLLEQGVKLVQKAQLIGEADRELLPSDLVVAIDDLSQTFGGQGDLFLDMVDEMPKRFGLDQRPSAVDDWLCLVILENARKLGEALRRHNVV